MTLEKQAVIDAIQRPDAKFIYIGAKPDNAGFQIYIDNLNLTEVILYKGLMDAHITKLIHKEFPEMDVNAGKTDVAQAT